MPKSIRADFSEGFRDDDVEAARACVTLAGVTRVYVTTSRPPGLAVELAPEAPTPDVEAAVSYLRRVAHLGNVRLTDESAYQGTYRLGPSVGTATDLREEPTESGP